MNKKPIHPKKYYKKLKFRSRIGYLLTLLFALAFTFAAFCLATSFWKFVAIPVITAKIDTVAASVSETWKQVACVGLLGLIALAVWKTWLNKRIALKYLKREMKNWHGFVPPGPTPFVKNRLLLLYVQKIKGFWLWFMVLSSIFVLIVYTSIAGGICIALSHDKFTLFQDTGAWKSFFTDFTNSKIVDKIFIITLFVFVAFNLLWALTQASQSTTINRIWRVYGHTNEEMIDWYHKFIAPKATKVNGRYKTVSLIIFSVLGIVIYIIFKRLIIAVFNKSFPKV